MGRILELLRHEVVGVIANQFFGGGHGSGGTYGQHLMHDFFVHHLLKVEPPEWNKETAAAVGG